jgi:NAD(P)-dependent dehydrogenase (short-subunit alcohol dehydrogenase family)
MTNFKGKVFTVTGAASDIGRVTTVRLAQLGASGIASSDVDVAGLEQTEMLCMCIRLSLLSGIDMK